MNCRKTFSRAGSSLAVFHSGPVDAFRKLLTEFNVRAVYANHDYEPYAFSRDTAVGEFLKESGIQFHTFKDQVIFEKNEVLKSDGTPYTVFTPYANAWKRLFTKEAALPYPSQDLTGNLLAIAPGSIPSASELGFLKTGYIYSAPEIDTDIIKNYHTTRNIPSLAGTSRARTASEVRDCKHKGAGQYGPHPERGMAQRAYLEGVFYGHTRAFSSCSGKLLQTEI